MRAFRRAFIGGVVLIVASIFLVGGTAAATPAVPVAPYTAFTMHFAGWGNIDGSFSYEASRTTLDVYQQNANGYALVMVGLNGNHDHYIDVTPPVGTKFVAGTTYQTVANFNPLPTETVLNLNGDGQGCSGVLSGSLTVEEAVYDPATSKFTAFAASFSEACSGSEATATGEIRFQSSIGYQAADSVDYQLPFGSQPVGIAGTAMDSTVQVDGTIPTTFGVASIGGDDPSAFAISSNTCTGETISYGQTCAVHITPTATAIAYQTAILTIVENSTGDTITRLLSLNGFDPREATISGILDFGWLADYETSAPQTVTLTGAGMLPITFGQAAIVGPNAGIFSTTADSCSGVTLGSGQTCSMTVIAHPTTVGVLLQATLSLPDDSVAGSTQVTLNVDGFAGDKGTFYPLTPARILDTRSGVGASKAKVGPGGVIHLQVTGRGGVPGDNVSAVVLNVTVTGPTVGGFLTVYPTGVTRPNASSLNFTKGWTGANSVTIALGTNGKVDLYNASGSTSLIADVSGYYSSGNPPNSGIEMGGQYHPVVPFRLADTRTWTSLHGKPVPANNYILVPASVSAAVNSHVRAFAVNITAVGATGSGFITAWNGDPDALPNASTLNYSARQTVANFAIIPTAPCVDCGSATGWPSIGVYTAAATNIIVDIVGYYDDATVANGLRFEPMVPVRITDTRSGLGYPSAIGPGATATIAVPPSVVGDDTVALAMNLTAVHPTQATFLSVWPAGVAGVGQPNVSNVNPAAGAVVPNAVQTLIGPADEFNVFNNHGSVDVIVDVVGTFYLYPGTASAQSIPQAQLSDGPSGTMASPGLVRSIG